MLNGIDVDGLQSALAAVGAQPEAALARKRARVRWLDQVSEAELIYYVDGKRYVQAFEMRWYLAAELKNLLARAGFRVREVYGDFKRGPLVDGCPEIVVVAELD